MIKITDQTQEYRAERIAYLTETALADPMFAMCGGTGAIYDHPASSDFCVVYNTTAESHDDSGFVCNRVAIISA